MEGPTLFLTLGGLFLAGLLADLVGRRTRLPRVTLLLACGLVAGRSGFGLLPEEVEAWYGFLSVSALTMVAFLLGGSLTRENLARHGREILSISIGVAVLTWIIVSVGLVLLGAVPALAVLLGAIATATAPAATLDVLHQTGVRNGFTEALEGIVAIDDVWGLMIFSGALALAGTLNGVPMVEAAGGAAWEIGGAAALGIIVGFPAAYLTGRIKAGDPLRTEALGIVFLTAGLSIWLHVSFLIAGMTAGVIIVNFARHHERAFHEIEEFQWPFMVLFFILAGASLEVAQIWELGLLGVSFVVLRAVSRVIGAVAGARMVRIPPRNGAMYGMALMPQAGVAIGMALIASAAFPVVGGHILSVTIASTVFFEIFGPLATIWAVRAMAPESLAGSDRK